VDYLDVKVRRGKRGPCGPEDGRGEDSLRQPAVRVSHGSLPLDQAVALVSESRSLPDRTRPSLNQNSLEPDQEACPG